MNDGSSRALLERVIGFATVSRDSNLDMIEFIRGAGQLVCAAGAKPARLQNAMADDASKSTAEIANALRTPPMMPTPVPLATMAPKMATPVAPPTWRAVFSTADAVPAW